MTSNKGGSRRHPWWVWPAIAVTLLCMGALRYALEPVPKVTTTTAATTAASPYSMGDTTSYTTAASPYSMGDTTSYTTLARGSVDAVYVEATPTLKPTPSPTLIPKPTVTPKALKTNTIQLFEKIVEAEVMPSWSLNGYFLIAQTVVNQLNSGTKGDTLYEVLTHPHNYSVYSSGRYKRFTPSNNAKEAVRLALANELPPDFAELSIAESEVYKITAFCTESHVNKYPTGTHGRMTKVVQYENVWFFK